MAPIVHGLEAAYYDKVQFTYLDIDDPETTEFKEELGYIAQPHFFLLDENGDILNQWLGVVTADELGEAFRRATAK